MLLKLFSLCLISVFIFGCSDSPSQPEAVRSGLSNSVEVQRAPVRCYLDGYFDWEQFVWIGTITGDITGTVIMTPLGSGTPGQLVTGLAYFFHESWVISDAQGNLLLAGTHRGVEPMTDMVVSGRTIVPFVAKGYVTDASDEWAHLIGRTEHTTGEVTISTQITACAEIRIN